MKVFNTTAVCIPSQHYMVDISDRVAQIKKMVDKGEYFTINRARQYGKSTVLNALEDVLSKDYKVISLDFQDIENSSFASGGEFSKAFARILLDAGEFEGLIIPTNISDMLQELIHRRSDDVKMDELFRVFKHWFAMEKESIVLMIDEVDSATNNQVFLDFLAQLRSLYLKRQKNKGVKTFQSVILAGVTDVKHLKSKIRDEDQHKVNSPWNIAADFKVQMHFSAIDITGMLNDYEADHHTGMNTNEIGVYIESYTSGYPFLVSRICQLIDESLVPEKFSDYSAAWTKYGIDEAVKLLLSENNSLFDSIMGKLVNFPDLNSKLKNILLRGYTNVFLPDDEGQKQLCMYGFIYNNRNTVAISNRIFEARLYKHFIGEIKEGNALVQAGALDKSIFVEDGWLNVPKILEHFIQTYNRIYGEQTQKILEEEGRERFLMYLSPIINGTGTYDIEPQTRNHLRMDVVIHYLGRRYVIELKIWRGPRYNEKGEAQIMEYLDYFGLNTGYMLSFNFNKNKQSGVKRISLGDKVLFEGTV